MSTPTPITAPDPTTPPPVSASAGQAQSVLRHGPIYLFGGILNRGAGIILLPIYLHAFSTAEFGVYAVLISLMDILGIGVGLSIGWALMRLMVDAKTPEQEGEIIGSAFVGFGLVGASVLLLAIPAGFALDRVFTRLEAGPLPYTLALAAVVCSAFLMLTLDVFRVWKRSDIYVLLSATKAALFIGLNLLALFVFDWGVAGVIASTLVSTFLLSAVAVFMIVRRAPLSFKLSVTKRLVRLGAGIVPGGLLDGHLNTFDKILVGAVSGPEMAGFLALAGRIAHMMRVGLVAPFKQIWCVERLEMEGSDTAAEIKGDTEVYIVFFALACFLAACVSVFAPEIIAVISDAAHAPAARFVPFAMGMLLLYLLSYEFELALIAKERTFEITRIALVMAVVGTVGYIVALHVAGALGVAAMAVVVFGLRAAMTIVLSQRVSEVARREPVLLFVAVALLTGLAFAAGAGLGEVTVPFGALVMKAAVLVLFAASLVAVLGRNPTRRAVAAHLFGRVMARLRRQA